MIDSQSRTAPVAPPQARSAAVERKPRPQNEFPARVSGSRRTAIQNAAGYFGWTGIGLAYSLDPHLGEGRRALPGEA